MPSDRPPTTDDATTRARDLADAEARLARIDEERAVLVTRVAALRQQRPQPSPGSVTAPVAAPLIAAMTPAEKVHVFRGLFRGRGDVFPRLWVNARTGRKGYAPACGNEWVEPLCDKPRVKCGACPNQAFIPVTDEVITGHLRGHHVVGVYPLLHDETCWFLALDFDKQAWRDDVTAVLKTCRALDVPAAVERSRSGNGAHIWFFFTEPVPAAAARRMGCFILTQTITRCRDLGLDSYDRLFPSQDTMPKGGFGNLIALPLQGEPRRHGNSVFLDDVLDPIPDQWAFLRGVRRMTRADVDQLALRAARAGAVLAVTDRSPGEIAPERGGASAESPMSRPPLEPLPATVRVVVSDRLHLDRDGLPASSVGEARRLAAFGNPEFYQRQQLRLSTARTPRVIVCAQDDGDRLALPRGCLDALRVLVSAGGSRLDVDDRRTDGNALAATFRGTLTPDQALAVDAMLAHETGVLVAPPGSGKTVMGAFLIASRGRATLVLVHRQPLLEQWVARLAAFLEVPPESIGRIGGGKSSASGYLDVATLQSLTRKRDLREFLAPYGHIVVDECHHIPAFSFETALAATSARFITGLTATPRRRDGLHPIIEMQLGPIRHVVTQKAWAATTGFRQRLIVRRTGLRGPDDGEPTVQEAYRLAVADSARDTAIIDDVISALEERRSPLVITERRDHLESLAAQLRPAARSCVVLHGGLKAAERRAAVQAIADGQPGQLVIATGRYVGEGFDSPRLDTLFLALPVSWKGTLAQYAGRLQRTLPGKSEIRVHDYVDVEIPILARMAARRHRALRALGFTVEAAQHAFVAAPTIEFVYETDGDDAAE